MTVSPSVREWCETLPEREAQYAEAVQLDTVGKAIIPVELLPVLYLLTATHTIATIAGSQSERHRQAALKALEQAMRPEVFREVRALLTRWNAYVDDYAMERHE